MNKNINNYEIDLFLNGKLSPEKIKEFELRMQTDPELKAAVEWSQKELNVSEHLIATNLKAQFTNYQKIEKNNKLKKKIITVGISFFILLLGTYIIYYYMQNRKYQEIKQDPILNQQPVESVPSPSMDTTRSTIIDSSQQKIASIDNRNTKSKSQNNDPGDNKYNDLLAYVDNVYITPEMEVYRASNANNITTIATKYWTSKNWSGVIESLSKIKSTDDNYWKSQWYIAHAYYNNKQYDQATIIFDMLQKSNYNKYKENAQWFYALSLIKQKQNNVIIKSTLTKILKTPGHNYYPEAYNLLSEVNKSH